MKRTTRILIVEDDTIIATDLKRTLIKSGYEVTAIVPSGEQALANLAEDPPDLVLMDIKLPGRVDGIDVAAHLHENSQVPVIYLTAHSNLEFLERSKPTEPYGYLLKPFREKELQANIEMALFKHQIQQQLRHTNWRLEQEIAERKRTEAALQESEQQLRLLNASKDTFFSIIAHDLRNPFSGLMMLTESLVENFETYEPERLKAVLTLLHNSSHRVYDLLNNLLEWSRLERGLLKAEPQTIFMAMLVQHPIDLLAQPADQKRITLRNLISKKLTAYADYHMISTVIRNLLSNALKFTPPDGTVTLSGYYREQELVVTVADTGIGMTPQQLDKLFRIDEKCSRPGTDGEVGAGLGLILCHELVKKNGGAISAASQVDAGTTFTITLPIAANSLKTT